MISSRFILLLVLFLLPAIWSNPLLAQDEDVIKVESEMVTISVSGGMNPTFSWSPDIKIGRLLVMKGSREFWGTETEGENIYQTSIQYGVHPPGAVEPEPAWPLSKGETYKIMIFRWISLDPEKFQLMGEKEFTISSESEQIGEPIKGLKPVLHINPLAAAFKLDGILDTSWKMALDSIADLETIEPYEGGQPEGETTIKVFADAENIVVIAQCLDDNPDGIVSYSKESDAKDDEGDPVMLTSEDHILIVFDTFLDGRSGYVFAVNAEGARFDGIIIEQGDDVNMDWNTVWEAKVSRDANGWYAEMRIPIKSLSFDESLDAWGFNVQRRVQRLQEVSRWSGISRDFEIYQTSVGGLLTGIPSFHLGMGLSVRPTLKGNAIKPSGVENKFIGDISFDISQRLGPNLSSALTINTDFAETEADIRQINLGRFELFLPEKRKFFNEGSDIFTFGMGLDEDNLLPFFSRRIGLIGLDEDEQVTIPINAGGKINGRVGNTNIGALIVNTRAVDSLEIDPDEDPLHIPQSTMGTIRISQNIWEESTVGILGTFGDQLGRSGAWSAGFDFNYQTSEFMDEKNFRVGIWALYNDREDLEGDKSALGLRVDYPNDLFDININSIRIGDGFDPSLGFVPRNDIHLWSFDGEYNPRPDWDLVREMSSEIALRVYNELDNSTWQSYELSVIPVKWLLESGDQIEISIIPQGDKPPEAFEVASDIDIPSGEFSGAYEWTRAELVFKSAEKRKISGGLKLELGSYYNGELSTVETSLAFKPSALFNFEITAEFNNGKVNALPDDVEEDSASVNNIPLEEVDFTEELFGLRIQINFTADLQFSSLTQYDTESGELGSNNRFRWQFDPLGEIFIVYNHNLLRREDKKWEFVSNQLPVKVQYTWRF